MGRYGKTKPMFTRTCAWLFHDPEDLIAGEKEEHKCVGVAIDGALVGGSGAVTVVALFMPKLLGVLPLSFPGQICAIPPTRHDFQVLHSLSDYNEAHNEAPASQINSPTSTCENKPAPLV